MNALNKINLFLIICVINFIAASSSKSFELEKCPKDPKIVAMELMDLSLYGYHLKDNDSCITQNANKFKYVIAANTSDTDGFDKAEVLLPDSSTYKIILLSHDKEMSNPYKDVYIVNFQIDLKDKKSFKDSFTMIQHKMDNAVKSYGCAEIKYPPSKIFVWKRCVKQ